MTEQQLAVAAQSAAEYAHIRDSRRLALSSEGAGWNGLTAQLFHYTEQRGDPMSVPPPLEDVITIHTAGVTEVEGKVGRRFPHHPTTSGDVFIIPRGEPTAWNWSTACSIFCVYIDRALTVRAAAEDSDLDSARIELIPRTPERDPFIHQLGLALLGELESPGPASRLYVDSLARSLTVHLLRQHAAFTVPTRDVEDMSAPDSLRRAREYIHDNLAQALRLPEIADAAGLSPYHLARYFKRVTGDTLHQYVVALRLEEAKRLLLNGNHTIAEVATLAGFADQSHLSRHFKQRFGVTPGTVLDQRTNLQSERTNLQDNRPRTE
jgi:AraC family transcriptional regulator